MPVCFLSISGHGLDCSSQPRMYILQVVRISINQPIHQSSVYLTPLPCNVPKIRKTALLILSHLPSPSANNNKQGGSIIIGFFVSHRVWPLSAPYDLYFAYDFVYPAIQQPNEVNVPCQPFCSCLLSVLSCDERHQSNRPRKERFVMCYCR